MQIITLLDHNNSPLPTLQFYRVLLDHEFPSIHLATDTAEALLYSMTGTVMVYANGTFLSTIGMRTSVKEPHCHCIRFPAMSHFTVTLTMDSFAADLLWVVDTERYATIINHTPYLHYNDTMFHTVGEESYRRRVAEVPRPAGYAIDCGETLNHVGATSSWPAHANAHDLDVFRDGKTTWQEGMFFVCPKPGTAKLDGLYSGGKIVNMTVPITNGSAMAMPLGSHPITAAPDSWMWYFWAYTGTALEKRYNRFATDVGVYEK